MPDEFPPELHGREADLHQALHDLLHQHHKVGPSLSVLDWSAQLFTHALIHPRIASTDPVNAPIEVKQQSLLFGFLSNAARNISLSTSVAACTICAKVSWALTSAYGSCLVVFRAATNASTDLDRSYMPFPLLPPLPLLSKRLCLVDVCVMVLPQSSYLVCALYADYCIIHLWHKSCAFPAEQLVLTQACLSNSSLHAELARMERQSKDRKRCRQCRQRFKRGAIRCKPQASKGIDAAVS